MGENNNKSVDTERTIGSENNPGSETSETAGTKRGRGRPRKSDSIGGSETETNLPRLVLVNEPGADEDPDQPEQKSKPRKRKNVNAELSKQQISVLIKTTFDIVGSRPGLELWKVSQQEADLLADPIAQIINKNPIVSGVASKYADYIGLIAAVCTVIIPRLFIQWAAKPKKNEVKNYVTTRQIDGKSKPIEPAGNGDKNGTPPNSNRGVDRKPPVSRSSIGAELYQLLPPIQ